jgi:hypothetical protein
MRKAALSLLAPLALAVLSGTASAHAHGGPEHDAHQHAAPVVDCVGVELSCADTATPAFAADGTLWLVWAAGGRISIAKSTDLAKTFEPAFTLGPTELPLDNGPDARPRIAVGPDGRLIVTFATRDDKYNGHAFITQSKDGGRTFSKPIPITAGSPSQRFETAAVDTDGRAFVAWIDKRNAAAARAAHAPYAGAALAYAWERTSGGSLSQARIARDNTCECCRIALAFAAPGRPVVLFRNIFADRIRDHAIVTFADSDTPGPLFRVSEDDAALDTCPHHGPSLAIGRDGTYHVTWFALGRKLKGLYYGRSTDGGKSFSPPMPLGDGVRQTSRPYVLAGPDAVYLAYKAFDGERTRVELVISRDAGLSWSKPEAAAETADASDHPLLVSDGHTVYLSWLTRADGYRLIPLKAKP